MKGLLVENSSLPKGLGDFCLFYFGFANHQLIYYISNIKIYHQYNTYYYSNEYKNFVILFGFSRFKLYNINVIINKAINKVEIREILYNAMMEMYALRFRRSNGLVADWYSLRVNNKEFRLVKVGTFLLMFFNITNIINKLILNKPTLFHLGLLMVN